MSLTNQPIKKVSIARTVLTLSIVSTVGSILILFRPYLKLLELFVKQVNDPYEFFSNGL